MTLKTQVPVGGGRERGDILGTQAGDEVRKIEM